MIDNRLIVCLASSWDLDPTSKHHLMRILARTNDVVWVNYHGSRRPSLNRSDRRAIASALTRVARGVQPIGPRMVQVTPLVLPGPPSPLRNALNRALLKAQISRAVRRLRRDRSQPVQLWTFAPDVVHLAGAFDEECLVYYCVDEFSQFPGFDASAIAAAEQQLIRAADVVITTSAKLHAARKDRHPRVHLVRHGVDHAHFAAAVDGGLPVPEVLRRIPRPIAGFIGLVQHWFDVDLLAGVARSMPDVSFAIVGECQIDVTALKRLPNVHFTGRQPYAALPAFCAAFDIGLIPFVRSPMTDNVNPIKLREYLAAGLPVVSTDLPEVRPFAPHALLADGIELFAAACRRALAETHSTTRRAAHRVRSAAVADQSWEAVTARVSQLVMDAIPKGADRAADQLESGSLAPSPC